MNSVSFCTCVFLKCFSCNFSQWTNSNCEMIYTLVVNGIVLERNLSSSSNEPSIIPNKSFSMWNWNNIWMQYSLFWDNVQISVWARSGIWLQWIPHCTCTTSHWPFPSTRRCHCTRRPRHRQPRAPVSTLKWHYLVNKSTTIFVVPHSRLLTQPVK